ncbi:MAG: 3-hydroxyacyl-CoA dehydrogenase family protein [Chloroflexi bacterium]|nr:3-hydroxyacyl-CoA dehydrogenase family protein [Chloroflexota bacterium]
MEINNIAVAGAGIMGSGIAQVAAQSGFSTTMHDVEDRFIQRGLDSIEASLQRLIRSGNLTPELADAATSRIRTSTDLEDACRGADIVIEAVPEDLELKKRVFCDMDALCPSHTILASNTSQFSITAIASATKRARKVVGTHWFNPPVIMRLIEIVRGLETSDETLAVVRELAQRLGKETVVCRDVPGFITTRATLALRIECYRMLEEGLASKEDIDKAIRLGLNHPMGPFELGDFVGHDTSYRGLTSLAEAHGDRFRPTPMLRNLVDAGHLGRKSGKGWYDYADK